MTGLRQAAALHSNSLISWQPCGLKTKLAASASKAPGCGGKDVCVQRVRVLRVCNTPVRVTFLQATDKSGGYVTHGPVCCATQALHSLLPETPGVASAAVKQVHGAWCEKRDWVRASALCAQGLTLCRCARHVTHELCLHVQHS